jgi:hypothetical protein
MAVVHAPAAVAVAHAPAAAAVVHAPAARAGKLVGFSGPVGVPHARTARTYGASELIGPAQGSG